MKQGRKGAREYATAAATLSDIPAIYKTPTKKKRATSMKRATTNPKKL